MKPFNFLASGSHRAMLCLLITAIPYLSFAQVTQSLLFADTPTLPSALTESQLGIYNKLTAPGLFSELRIIQFNSLAAVEQDGNVKVNVVGNVCGEVTFRAVGVDYNNENDYFYYGRMNPMEGSDCMDGELTLTKMTAGITGELRIGKTSYSITDLGGGKQVLGRIPAGSFVTCGGAIEDALQSPEDGPTGDRSGTSCNIRVLVIISASASTTIPNSPLLASSAINKANQTLFNSAVFPSSGKFILVNTVDAPSGFDETGMTTSQALTSISGNQDAINLQNTNGADIVVLYVNPDIMNPNDDDAGVAFLGGRWAVVDYNSGDQSRTFVHEIGHCLRGNHQFCPPSPIPMTSGCFPLNATGPAHAHEFISGGNNNRKTMMYGQISSDMISHYSNPNVNFEGVATGIVGTRDNASVMRGYGCTAANHSTLFDDAFFVNINGPYYGCPNSYQTFSANVTGNGLGTLTYEWRMAIGGVNYGPIFSTNSFVTIQLPSTPNQMVSLKLTVTSSIQGTKSATNYVGVTNCGGLKPDKPTGGTDKIASISAYPNPSQGSVQFEIIANEDVQNGRLSILDQYGKVIRNIQIEAIGKASTMNLNGIEGLPTGLYSFVLNFGSDTKAGKFSVIR